MEQEILASIKQELAHVTQMQSELDKLIFHYERYRFLTQDLRERLARLKKLELLLSAKPKVASLPLWELIELFLHVKSEANVRDIQEFLKTVGQRGVSPQAIFSALKIHGDIFHSRKKGKEQLVSLKSPSSGMRPVRFDHVIQEVQDAITKEVGPNVLQEVAEGLGLEVVKREVTAIQKKEKID